MMGKLLSYPRGVLLILWFLAHTLISSLTFALAAIVIRSQRYLDFHQGFLWATPPLWLSGLTLEVRGKEHLKSGQGGILVFNHTSWLDILVMCAGLPLMPRFGAKIELFRIPIFGWALRKAGALPIDRKNRHRVLEIYRQAEERVRQGEIFALAPEGTRQVGHNLGKFKQGPFLFAINSHSPIIPLVIAGAQEAMPKTSWLINVGVWRRKIIMEVLPPVSTDGLKEQDVSSLQDKTRETMAQTYAKLNRELGVLKP